MASPWHHALSSVKKWGGEPEDYLAVHSWFDASKEQLADFRHRALRHHTQGIFESERVFGATIELSTCYRCGKSRSVHVGGMACGDFQAKRIPTRWVGEQHVQEDLGCIPNIADWFLKIEPEPWMNRARRLSRELEESV